MRLSVIVITYGRPELLRRCLESLEAAGAPAQAEVRVGFNGLAPGEEALPEEIGERFPWAGRHLLERCSRGEARNRMVERSGGRWLFFLDDDATVPRHFLRTALEKIARYPDASALGGPNLGPSDATAFQRAVDFLLRSPLGSGPMRVRWIRSSGDRPLPGWTLTCSNLAVRRELFEREGLRFPPDCASAEENLLLHEAERLFGRPVFCPELFVYHRRRDSLSSFCRQVFLCGQGRMEVTRKAPGSLQATVLLPPAFAAYASALPFLPAAAAYPLALYLAALVAETLRLAVVERDPAAAVRLPAALVAGHFAYAAGLAAGLASPQTLHERAPSQLLRDVRPARL